MSGRDLTLLGLAADIPGAILLARGFMTKGILDIYDETGTRLGRNLAMVKSAMLQRAEAWGGGALLFVGFLLQMLAALEVSSGSSFFLGWSGLIILLVIATALFTAFSAICRRVGLVQFYEWALRNYDGKPFSSPSTPHERQELLHHGRLYGLKPSDGESLDDFAARLNRTVSELGLKHRGKVSLPTDE